MRKVILFIASSLDGYIATSSGGIDWLFTDYDYGYTKFFANIDTVLMGRHTYDQVLSFGEYPYAGTQGFVFSKKLQKDSDANVQFKSNPVSLIQELKSSTGKDIWLVGGSKIIQLCLQNDLIDKLIISIHPIILGEGIPLFSSSVSMKKLQLEHSEAFDTGLLQVTYIFNKQ